MGRDERVATPGRSDAPGPAAAPDGDERQTPPATRRAHALEARRPELPLKAQVVAARAVDLPRKVAVLGRRAGRTPRAAAASNPEGREARLKLNVVARAAAGDAPACPARHIEKPTGALGEAANARVQ